MVLSTDIPDSLPDRLHDALAYLGAVLYTISNAEADGSMARQQSLLGMLGEYEQDLAGIFDARSQLEAMARTGG